jgi:release factor glutamine methyltransferase
LESFRIVEYFGYKICVNDEVYIPSDDTELLLKLINIRKNELVIDVGSGSGILGLKVALEGGKVIFIDINPHATRATLCTLRINNIDDSDVLNCDLLTCIRDKFFDTIIFNPPYLPFEEYNSWIGFSWSGGKGGVEVILRFLKSLKSRKVYLVYSTSSNFEVIEEYLSTLKFSITKKIHKTVGFETLFGIEAVKHD